MDARMTAGMDMPVTKELIEVMRTMARNVARGLKKGGRLTIVGHKPSIVIEQVTSSYSFRFPELSQPI